MLTTNFQRNNKVVLSVFPDRTPGNSEQLPVPAVCVLQKEKKTPQMIRLPGVLSVSHIKSYPIFLKKNIKDNQTHLMTSPGSKL